MQNNTTVLAPGSRILILRLSAIGDVLHATPVARHLKELYPDCRLTWLVSPPADKLLAGNPYIDELLLWDRRPLDEAFARFNLPAVLQELKKARALLKARSFDLVLDIQGLFLTGILAVMSGAPRRIGIHERHEGNSLFMTEAAPDIPHRHKVHRYLSALLPLGFDMSTFTPGLTLPLPSNLDGFAARFWQQHGLDASRPLLLAAIRTTWANKNWAPKNFGLALQGLPKQIQLVFCGTLSDAVYIQEAQQYLHRPSISIAGQTNLLELATLLKSATLLLTCDTGPLHIADAVGCPTLSLWGPTQPDIYGPLTPGHAFILSPHHCRGCLTTKCQHPADSCMNAITPEMVTAKLRELLG